MISVVLVLIVSVVCFYTVSFIGYRVVALILLMTASFIAMLFEIIPVLMAAIVSAIIWNFYFIPPIYTFHINNAEDFLMFLLYFVIALVNAVLTFKIKEAESKVRDREEKVNTIKLYNTLLNSLSHELRTPISTILGAVDTLKENKARLTSEHQIELLSEIDTASLRLNEQVENLLNMSRLESGTLKPRMDWCDLNELVHQVANKFSLVDGHHIKIGVAESLPLLKLDGGIMEQILYNLIQNALQHTPKNTTIEIEISHHLNNCKIEIADNGQGFTKEDALKAFDKFYRSPKARTGGSGLGLSIVKGFVEALNGTIKLESKLGSGTKFTIEIPAETTYINNLKNE